MDASSSQRAFLSAATLSTSTPPTTPFSATSDIPSPEICVICLDLLARSDTTSLSSVASSAGEAQGDGNNAHRVATALPCQHAQFHQSCLGTWLSHSPSCPLCKTTVLSISIHRDDSSSPEIIKVPRDTQQTTTSSASRPTQSHATRRPTRRRHLVKSPIHEDPILRFRRSLYARGIPSLYRGRGITRTTSSSSTNSHTRRHRPLRPQPLTPASFSPANPNSARLLRLATIWIRRELQLFPFLHPTSLEHIPSSSTTSPSSDEETLPTAAWLRPPPRRTTAAFLLPYILAVLKAIDLKGAAGQAQVLLGEYLGKENAVLFCHELYAFLGSGVEEVSEWDGNVQYWVEEGDEGDGKGVLWSGKGEVLGMLTL